MRLLITILLTVLFFGNPGQALTVTTAQVCANELLNAYNERRFPRKFLAIESITSRAFGSTFRQLTSQEREQAINVAARLLRESFEEPSGKYRYRDLVVDDVEQTNGGNFRIIGSVHVTSPKFTGTGSFLALTTESCQIFQVRIVDVATLDGSLREMLLKDPITSELMQR